MLELEVSINTARLSLHKFLNTYRGLKYGQCITIGSIQASDNQ